VNPVQRFLIAAIVIVGGMVGFGSGRTLFRPAPPIVQPIAFNHQTHAGELEITCDVCHEFYTSSRHSGLPTLTTCMDCHEEALSESPEEQKIRDQAEAGQVDVFRKLFKLPDHAFYSHRRHVTVGEIPCEICHGEIAATTAPPERPLVRLTMDFCIECHEQVEVRTECTACHR